MPLAANTLRCFACDRSGPGPGLHRHPFRSGPALLRGPARRAADLVCNVAAMDGAESGIEAELERAVLGVLQPFLQLRYRHCLINPPTPPHPTLSHAAAAGHKNLL